MRVAFADLMFSWPPHGGADVDVYHTVKGIQGLGHEVHLFGAACASSWERGRFEPPVLPFPATRLDFGASEFNRRDLPKRFQSAVASWKPDVVCLCDMFFLEPYVAEALSEYRLISRYYAYECVCPRSLLLFRDGAPCPNSFLRTPNVCRRCALGHLKGEITRWQPLAWTQEYLAARAFMQGHYEQVRKALGRFESVVVYNELQRRLLGGVNANVHIVPGGVNIGEFDAAPVEQKDGRVVVLMTGRAEDPVKGLSVLREAAVQLARARDDFEVWVTEPEGPQGMSWYRSVGWQDRNGMKKLYRTADICVVPSVWEEPFGMVAVEAMASGLPVCASRVGGLQGIVRHGETGFLFERGNSAELAERLGQLFDDAALRRRMGEAGRAVAEEEYAWERVIKKHWPAILAGEAAS